MKKNISLSSVEVKMVKCFSHQVINLSDGITTIEGRNGSGKSTIVEGIANVLSNTTMSDKDLRDKQSPAEVNVTLSDGTSFGSTIKATVDNSGKVIKTQGGRTHNGVGATGKEIAGLLATAGNEHLFDVDAALKYSNASECAYKLANVQSFAEWFMQNFDEDELKHQFRINNCDFDKTVGAMNNQAAQSRRRADDLMMQKSAFLSNINDIPSCVTLPQGLDEEYERLFAEKQGLLQVIAGANATDNAARVAIEVAQRNQQKLNQEANRKEQEADVLVKEAQRKSDAMVDERNRVGLAAANNRRNEINKAKSNADRYADDARRHTNNIKDMEDKIVSLNRDLAALRVAWVAAGTAFVCEKTGADCELIRQMKGGLTQEDIQRNAAELKKQLEQATSNIEDLKAMAEEAAQKAEAYQKSYDSACISYKDFTPEARVEVDKTKVPGYLEAMADAYDLREKARNVEIPTFSASADGQEAAARISQIDARLAEIAKVKNEVDAKNAEHRFVVANNDEQRRKADKANDDAVKCQEQASALKNMSGELTKAYRSYCQEASDKVNSLFEASVEFLPGLVVKLFEEEKGSLNGRRVFKPQIIRPDGSISESLSDGESRLYGIALIRFIFQRFFQVEAPILVDRAEAVDSDRLAVALDGVQAIVARRTDCDLTIR